MGKKILQINKKLIFKTIMYVFFTLVFSLVEPILNMSRVGNASPKNSFKITRNTLDHLQREGFTKSLADMFAA